MQQLRTKENMMVEKEKRSLRMHRFVRFINSYIDYYLIVKIREIFYPFPMCTHLHNSNLAEKVMANLELM